MRDVVGEVGLRQAHEREIAQALRRDALQFRQRVIRTHHQDRSHATEFGPLKSGGGGHRWLQRDDEVHLPFSGHPDHLQGRDVQKLDPHLWVLCLEPLQRAGKNTSCRRRGVGDAQHFVVSLATHPLHGQFGAREHFTRFVEEAFAGIGQLHGVLPAYEQRHAQLVLQIPHLAAERGLGEVEDLRGTIEGPVRCHDDKVAEVAKFHPFTTDSYRKYQRAQKHGIGRCAGDAISFSNFQAMSTIHTNQLPEAVAKYLEAANRFDATGAAACFTPHAIVRDEQKDHVGSTAIEHWISQTSLQYRPQATVVHAQTTDDRLQMVVNVAGNFPGSPVELDYELRLQEGKIARLTIQ